jgi:hypothetical protein
MIFMYSLFDLNTTSFSQKLVSNLTDLIYALIELQKLSLHRIGEMNLQFFYMHNYMKNQLILSQIIYII